MNATSAGRCAEDDDEDDEDGEAADMEGLVPPFCVFASIRSHRFFSSSRCPPCLSFPEYEESGLLETDEVGARHCRDRMSANLSAPPPHTDSPLSRRPWTPVRWSKRKPKRSLETRTSFFRPEHMTCTSHTINTTRPLDSGCLDTMKYVKKQKKKHCKWTRARRRN